MNRVKFFLVAFVGVTALVMAATATGQETKTRLGCATVVRVEGQVEYNLGDGNWHPLVAGKVLAPGSTIRTLFNGKVDVVLGREIEFPQAKPRPDRIGEASDAQVTGYIDYRPSAEQNAIRLTPDTTVSIDKLFITDTGADSVSDTELNLTQGKIFCSVKKLTGASKYLVKFPKGIAGVRGTKFSIDVNGIVVCFESTSGGVLVSFTDANGNPVTFLITPGNCLVDPATGQTATISASDMAFLNEVFISLRTLYLIVLDFNYDRTECFVSTIRGLHGRRPSGGPWWWW